jgi:nitroreductase/NAD-dependent dihydropyrimidine dehydrogenase PreA subunit
MKYNKIEFIHDKCTQCKLCVKDCPQLAIHPEHFSIDANCIDCHHCVSICPAAALMVDGTVPPDLKPINIQSDDFINLLKSRRSVRRYSDQPVSEEVIAQLIQAFQLVPTAKNAKESYIKVISDEKLAVLDAGVTKTINRTFKRLFNRFTCPVWFLIAPKKARVFFKTTERFIERQSYQSNIITHNAPIALLFHAPKSVMSNGQMDNNIAASYLSLYAITLNLGTCFNGYIVIGLKQNKELAKEMGIPEGHQVFSALLVGYPKYKYLREVVR